MENETARKLRERLATELDNLPTGSFYAELLRFRKYSICAYPGKDIVVNGRAEHEPLHIHVHYDGKQLRIDCNELCELDGKRIPKDLRKYLVENKSLIAKLAGLVYHTGKLEKSAV